MWWTPEQLGAIDAALRAAKAGTPTLLSIEGISGQGKTSLLAEVVRRSFGFGLLRADADVRLRSVPYGIFDQWGVPQPSVQTAVSPFQMAQNLRQAVDECATTGPVLLLVDDLQWADPESVEALGWLLRRAAGDRLLVAAATSPLAATEHASWRRLLLAEGTIRIRLDGLRLAEARALLSQLAPGLDDSAQERLWAHTDGNPLFLRALLAEHEAAELAAATVLPSPQDLTSGTATRLDALSSATADLVRAAAILGPSWSPVALAAAVAGLAETSEALDDAVASGLVELRPVHDLVEVRVVHAMLRSAVEAGLPAARRRELHLRAAAVVAGRGEALRHRFEAIDRFDDVLADDLARYADALHNQGAYREAARQLDWASACTTDPTIREQRWLDGLFELILARDDETVTQSLSDIGWAADEVRRTLVLAAHAIITRRWLAARHLLDALPPEVLAAADGRTTYRVVVVRAWCRVMTGSMGPELVPDLTRAMADPARDDALYGYLAIAMGQVAIAADRHDDQAWRHAEPVRATRASAATQVTGTAWRGMLFALSGRFAEATALLESVTREARDGLTSFGEGVFHAYLGYAWWMRGAWPAADRALGLARDARFGPAHPMVAAATPLLALSRNNPAGALEDLSRARAVLLDAPWRPALQVAAIAMTLTRRLHGTPEDRRRILPELQRSFGAGIAEPAGLQSPVWLTHLALTATWTDQLQLAEQIAERLDAWQDRLSWLGGAAAWIRGLVAERADDQERARHWLTAALGTGLLASLPLHEALVTDDLARVETALDRATAARTRQQAAERFLSLGLPCPDKADQETSGPASVLDVLSDRERDVVGLLVEGMSSAQIARELYITRSTVTFHLSRAFAKTNTGNRFELVDLIRRERRDR